MSDHRQENREDGHAPEQPRTDVYVFSSRRMTNKSSDREQQIRGIQRIAFTIFGAAMAYEFVKELIFHILALHSKEAIAGLATGAITISILVLVFLWYESSSREFNFMNRWCSLEHTAPSTTLGEVAIATGVALVLAALFYAVRTPLYFAAIFTGYSIIDSLLQMFVVRKQLALSLSTSRQEITHDLQLADEADDRRVRRQLNAHLNAIKGLEDYYFDKRQDLRRILIAVASLGLFSVIFFHKPDFPALANPDELRVFPAVHYRVLLGYVVLIIFTEIWMHRFRLPLLRTMREAEKMFQGSTKSSQRRPVASE